MKVRDVIGLLSKKTEVRRQKKECRKQPARFVRKPGEDIPTG